MAGMKKRPRSQPGAFSVKRLSLDDLRRNEEDQFLGLCAYRGALEQVTEYRDAAQERYLSNVGVVLRLDDTADDHGASIRNQHVGRRLLGVEGGVGLRTGDFGKIRHRVFQIQVQEDRVFGRNLRSYFQPQESIDVLHSGRAA